MSYVQVTPEELAVAGTGVGRCSADLDGPHAAVSGTAAAAAGTPAAGAYEALIGDLQKALESLQTATDELGRALGRASSNYARTEQSITACYAPRAGG